MELNYYVKRPIRVTAIQFDGGNYSEILQWEEKATGKISGNIVLEDDGHLLINTLEGTMECPIGAFIICGVRGEVYPCDEGIFDESYTEFRDEEE